MQTTTTPPAKKGLRQRLSASVRNRWRSTSPVARAQASSQVGAPVPSVPAARTPTPAPQSTVVSSPAQQSLLSATLDRLLTVSPEDHAIIQSCVPSSSNDANDALSQALTEAKTLQKNYLDEKWKFTFNGRTYAVRDKADKLIQWFNRLQAVGDVAASIDPIHVGFPWAGICLLLKTVTSDSNQMASLLPGCETVLYMSNRLKAYTEFLVRLPSTLARSNLETALVEFYVCILIFLARAIRLYRTSTARRMFEAFWSDNEVIEFESKCNLLGLRLEAAASSCDRLLFEEHLQQSIEEMRRLHEIQESLDRIETTANRIEIQISLEKLPRVRGAEFDAYNGDHKLCHPKTRIDILRQIQSWAQQPDGRRILWLNGKAGTGKSTISRTIAEWLHGRPGGSSGVDLGASFFFKRGEGDRGSAARFFPTIVQQLANKVPELVPLVAKAIELAPDIGHKKLGEQFERLIFQPVQALGTLVWNRPALVVVVDALDECEKPAVDASNEHERYDDIRVVLQLWSRLASITGVDIRLFVTSRPDLPILDGFLGMSSGIHRDIELHNVPEVDIRQDISLYIRDTLCDVRKVYNTKPSLRVPLSEGWPGETVLHTLADTAVPLFIAAATMCRFISDRSRSPQRQLDYLLQFQRLGDLSAMERTYLPVLKQLPINQAETCQREVFYKEFRTLVGTIISLAEPLSVSSLVVLLQMPQDDVVLSLDALHSVLFIPTDLHTPVRTMHLSFAEFLLSESLRGQPWAIDSPATHFMLKEQCLRIMSDDAGLRENICGISSPAQLRQQIGQSTIESALPVVTQYACRYWVHHVQYSGLPIRDNDEVHLFLKTHFFHWLEALALLGRISIAVDTINILHSLLCVSPPQTVKLDEKLLTKICQPSESTLLSSFLKDARRFVLTNRYLIDLAPLQLYSSATLFAPQTSVVCNDCGHIPSWIIQCPSTPQSWSHELQRLEGHTNTVFSIAFSPNGKLLASGTDEKIHIWDIGIGQEVQKLEGHTDLVIAVVFSTHDGRLLLSGSHDGTIRFWDTGTGQEIKKIKVPFPPFHIGAFSPGGKLFASGSAADNHAVRVWDIEMEQEAHILKDHTNDISALTFSTERDPLLASGSDDGIIWIWKTITGQRMRKLEHTTSIWAASFSSDSNLLISGSSDGKIWVWEIETGQQVQRFNEQNSRMLTAAFSPNGNLLASAFGDPVQIWNVDTGQAVRNLEGHTGTIHTMAFSFKGELLATGSADGTARIWDMNMTEDDQSRQGHTGSVMAVTFSSDGKLFASASWDETVRIWEVRTGQEICLLEHSNPVSTVVFSTDSTLLASGSSGDIVIWDIRTRQRLQEFKHVKEVRTIAFSTDSMRLATGHYKDIKIWDRNAGLEVRRITVTPHITCAVAFSPDDKSLVSVFQDGPICMWDTSTGQKTAWLDVSTDPQICGIPFTSDGKRLITDQGTTYSLNDDTVTASVTVKDEWIYQDGHKLLWLPHEYRTARVAVHGNMIGFGQQSGRVSFIELAKH